jgi:hypothetical protein
VTFAPPSQARDRHPSKTCSGTWIVCHCVSWRIAVSHLRAKVIAGNSLLLVHMSHHSRAGSVRSDERSNRPRSAVLSWPETLYSLSVAVVRGGISSWSPWQNAAAALYRAKACISNLVLIDGGLEALTDRIACDMLYRKLEHRASKNMTAWTVKILGHRVSCQDLLQLRKTSLSLLPPYVVMPQEMVVPVNSCSMFLSSIRMLSKLSSTSLAGLSVARLRYALC